MKCPVCDYEKGYEWNENEEFEDINPEGKDFVKCQGFYIENKYSGRKELITLYICPHCNSVRGPECV